MRKPGGVKRPVCGGSGKKPPSYRYGLKCRVTARRKENKVNQTNNSRQNYNTAYVKEHYVQLSLKIKRDGNQDVLSWLEVLKAGGKMTSYILNLIVADIEKNG